MVASEVVKDERRREQQCHISAIDLKEGEGERERERDTYHSPSKVPMKSFIGHLIVLKRCCIISIIDSARACACMRARVRESGWYATGTCGEPREFGTTI